MKDQRWSYEGLLPYFRRCETWHDESGTEGEQQHGFEGPVHSAPTTTTTTTRKYELGGPVKEAYRSVGIKDITDHNGS